MPSSLPPDPRPSWQDPGQRPAPPSRPALPENTWRTPSADTGPDRPRPSRRRLFRLAAALGLLFLLSGILIWLLLWLAPPGPATLLLVGAGYEDNLAIPLNARGRNALTSLAALATPSTPAGLISRSGQLRRPGEPVELRRGDNWAREIARARERTVVVYFAVHGGADTRGAYLLPQDAGLAEDDRLRLESVLEAMQGKNMQGKNKVLILDATRLPASPGLGMLHNDFARALSDLEEKIASIPNLVVLSASDIDQRSWDDPARPLTLFSQQVIEGLRGAADTNGDGRIDALELYDYVRAGVEKSARAWYGVTQTPVLLPRQGGVERARRMHLAFRSRQPVPEPAQDDSLSEIRAAWQRYRELRTRFGPLFAADPTAWRRWEALLLRHEQLLLAGDRVRAALVLEQAGESERQLRRVLASDLPTVSLAVPAVQGDTALDVTRRYPPLDELWVAAVEKRAAVWERIQKEYVPTLGRAELRRRMREALVRRAGDDLERAASLVLLLDDPSRPPRPAEAHLVVMLQRDLAQRPPDGELLLSLRQALRVRIQAERSALAVREGTFADSARVQPWLRTALAEADHNRERGQDLLFASEKVDWQKAGAFLTQASAGYAALDKRAGYVRDAYARRDRALARLPGYADWLNGRRPDIASDLEKSLQGCWRDVHALSAALANPGKTAPEELGRLGDAVGRSLTQLQQGLDAHAQTCETGEMTGQTELEALLAVPFLDVEKRMRLLAVQQRLARRGPPPETPPAPKMPAEVQAAARRQGWIALAALGRSAFEQDLKTGQSRAADVEHRLHTFSLDERWWWSLRLAGDTIGATWRRIPARSRQLLREAEKAPLNSARTELRTADELARRAYPGADLTGDPARTCQRLLRHDLILTLAERARQEHWTSESDDLPPWYRIAGQALLRAAADTSPLAVLKAERARVDRQLREPDGLALRVPPLLDLTAGERQPLQGSLFSAEPGDTVGFPLVWAVPGDGVNFLGAHDGRRAAQPLEGSAAAPLQITVTSRRVDAAEAAPPEVPEMVPTAVRWVGYYRGQRLRGDTAVRLHLLPEVTQQTRPRPGDGAIAVRAEPGLLARFGRGQGALAFVIDCSGSMGPPRGGKMTEKTRYRLATTALAKVLANVPRGTLVSVWTFGQAMGGEKTVKDAERTIERLQEPIAWRPDRLEGLIARLETLEPWNESPVTRAIFRAREDLVNAPGFRSLIVLTDGADNRWATDKVGNPGGESVEGALRRRFRGSGIMLNVVGFQAEAEEKQLRAQFSVVRQLDPPGTLTTVQEINGLIAALERATRPAVRVRLVRQGLPPIRSGGAPWRDDPIDVNPGDENDRWLRIPASELPATYRLQLTNGGGIVSPPLAIAPGDRLLLGLSPNGRAPIAERLVYSLDPVFRLRPGKTERGWRVGVLQNQTVGSGRELQLLVTVEQIPEPGPAVVRLVRPEEMWVELDGPEGSAPFALRWGEDWDYPAPAWSLTVPAWPTRPSTSSPLSPELRVWWSPDLKARATVLRRGPDFRLLTDLAREVMPGVRLEAMTVERRAVRTGDGVELRWCVVLRARHAEGRPVRLRVEGLPMAAGVEERYYARARKVAIVMWFAGLATEEAVGDVVERTLEAVRVVPLADFRREAEARGNVVRLRLPAPATTPLRPERVGE